MLTQFFEERRQMSSEQAAVSHTRTYRPRPRPDLTIRGEVWKPRANIADMVGFSDRTASRMNWRTSYIAGVAYCPEEESLASLIDQSSRRHKPAKHRRRA
jgi:hypothetical protein